MLEFKRPWFHRPSIAVFIAQVYLNPVDAAIKKAFSS